MKIVNVGDTLSLLVRLFAGDTQIVKADMASLVWSLRDVETGGTINERTDIDLLPSTATNGDITIELEAADNAVVTATLAEEVHQLLIRCHYGDAQVGSHVELISVVNTAKLP